MEHMLIVHVLQRQRSLGKPSYNLSFRNLLASLSGSADPLVEVSTVCVIHDYGQRAILRKAFAIAHNIRMLQAG
jgi:hypothetical protein